MDFYVTSLPGSTCELDDVVGQTSMAAPNSNRTSYIVLAFKKRALKESL